MQYTILYAWKQSRKCVFDKVGVCLICSESSSWSWWPPHHLDQSTYSVPTLATSQPPVLPIHYLRHETKTKKISFPLLLMLDKYECVMLKNVSIQLQSTAYAPFVQEVILSINLARGWVGAAVYNGHYTGRHGPRAAVRPRHRTIQQHNSTTTTPHHSTVRAVAVLCGMVSI